MAAPKGNKFAVGNKGGAPPYYSTPQELQLAIESYFAGNKKPTICGLALFLGFSSRQSLLDYQGRQEFFDIIRRAKLRIEAAYEEILHGTACTGAIFALKNFGWQDKTGVDANVTGELTIVRKIIHSKEDMK